ncbi:MAG: 30S ribosomal protein S9 [Candidatus Uhrbacteria bacterium GW2011_GWE2_45_35]|uniref:Small ribosomal subunit protein uS9 n=2 Tax=Candidatus Uhriibacteriota TaxID=1752732 RepID=A0A0G1JK82_9BACT|nr:MAG: 30S ribosomal protein S9 [Candidatus Uhrbacteria bacterium GW2011_GWF2_44_350]KKU08742.1 MAG: 30S ribosomal protein S9 [Candidatus Uhrbacteria bacterium GW2011_GWE2_45_35]HBR80750.1 30S ribosomal protein S9 [Candidatus Uhrbacteria bacterium]HCU31887.1 30S ribosomal protein S9 [Candidatus Uhrbacteria bacterium]
MQIDLSTKTLGRRKEAVVQIKLIGGTGKITVNEKPVNEYFAHIEYQNLINAPFAATGTEKSFDVAARAKGGGIKGQAEALQLAIARALIKENAELRATLKKLGFLSRDPRVKERKKYGKKKARRSPQWSKR